MKRIFFTVLAMTTTALASDMPIKATSPFAVMKPLAATQWGGLYAGLNLGWAYRGLSDLVELGGTTHVTAIRGVRVGAQVGYDYRFDQMLLGAVIDLGVGNVRGNNNGVKNETVAIGTHGALRARLGMIFNENTLLYGVGGLAYGHAMVTGSIMGYNVSTHRFGATIGAGGEYKMSSAWSMFSEYRYTDLGRWTYDKIIPSSANYTGHSVRVGTNYRF